MLEEFMLSKGMILFVNGKVLKKMGSSHKCMHGLG